MASRHKGDRWLPLLCSHPRQVCQSQSSNKPILSCPPRQKMGTRGLKGISEMNLKSVTFPPGKRNISGKNHDSGWLPSGTWLETRFISEEGTQLWLHMGRVLPSPRLAGQCSRKPRHEAGLHSPGSLLFSPYKNPRLTSRIPECLTSFIHSLIHAPTPHTFIKSSQGSRHWGCRDE
jgi:hypothetical protein